MPVAANIGKIEERICAACARSGRSRGEITLMAVTKFREPGDVALAFAAGLRCFGESRVQEAAAKFAGFREAHPGAELHFVGGLQRNKAKAAMSLFDCIQSVDREEIALELDRQGRALLDAARDGPEPGPRPGLVPRSMPVLLELRTGEDSKGGFADLDGLFRAAEIVIGSPCLEPRGLMTMAPFTSDEALLRAAFRKAAGALRELERRFPGEGRWRCLSMGMSGDFEIAVEEGSTLLRVGGAIFGG